MIRLNHPIFPSLIRHDDVSFGSWSSDSSKTTAVYTIDWNKLDKYKYERFVEDAKRHSMPDRYQFPGTLPEPYDSWVKGLEFSIPVRYLEEIRYNARMAQMIYCSPHPFDTMIREICCEPAIAHVFVAFRLIADCVYDRKKNYFYRGDDKILVPQALLYKFWSHQTGDGLIRDHAWFRRIEWLLDDKHTQDPGNDSATREVQKFITAIDGFQEKLSKLHEIRCADISPTIETTEPSLGDEKDKPAENNQTNYLIFNNDSSTTSTGDGVSLTVGPVSGNELFSVSDGEGNKVFQVTGDTKRPHVKTPVKTTNGDISVCTTCKNRNDDLVKSIHTWMKYGFGEIVIVDWGSDTPVTDSIKGLELPVRVKVVRVDEEPYFIASMAKNVGARICENDKILFMDADVKLKGFDYELKDSSFICGYPDVTGRGTTGACLIRRIDFDQINGFNEHMKYWGIEDINFYHRLTASGIEMEYFRPGDLDHMEHDDDIRLKYRDQEGKTKVEGQRYNINKAKPWKAHHSQKRVEAVITTMYGTGDKREMGQESKIV